MKYMIHLTAAMLLLCMNGWAQPKDRPHFRSLVSVGLLEGGSDENLQLQAINGFQFRGYSLGIGLGLDHYYVKTVPLFLDLRKNLWQKAQTPFVYAESGISFPWKRNTTETGGNSTYGNGFLYDAGAGYSLRVKGKLLFNLSAGYSTKYLKETRETINWILRDFPPYNSDQFTKDTTYYRYTLRRFSFRIGFSF